MDLNPFTRNEFHEALLLSKSVGEATGWIPVEFQHESSLLRTFIKDHSYGEYIFDWGWAEAFERHGLSYYPKLTSMIPFTPVTTNRFFGSSENMQGLLETHDEFYNNGNFSSAHFLFVNSIEKRIFEKNNYLIRDSLQYHFLNQNYESFDEFLDQLKSKKAKNISEERTFPEITFKRFSGSGLTDQHARRMYQFYISTITKKNSFDYLNEDFFLRIFSTLKDNILYIEAEEKDVPIAGSLFFYDSHRLYGRYWGSSKFIKNLHFELCYYQGIDFCIENKLDVFEAGAQGEHKVLRGFTPIKIFSAHKIKHPAFSEAIKNFILKEKNHIQQVQEQLSKALPYKKKGPS